MSDSNRERLLRAIAEEEARIAALTVERERGRQHLKELRTALAGCRTPPCAEDIDRSTTAAELSPTLSSAEKVRLFQGLFRGRSDVYPRLWNNARTGKKGYAPVCANEWVRGVCEKPRVKCGECLNEAFRPLDDQAILAHLQGRHVMGVYPLLPDESCWFLAADFDKSGWKEDVAAFVETCHQHDLPVAVERSRSGDGAHVWFFFVESVPSNTARRMGCYLITRTMARRHQLSMESYDRFFPNQDTMPAGGFGNLIALPLQHEARQRGNTLFVDANFEPHRGQWEYMSSLHRIDASTVQEIAESATRSGTIVGVRSVSPDDDLEAVPWRRSPSRKASDELITGPFPSIVRAVIGQKIFVEMAGLPSAMLNRIKRLAAFQNPEFYKKQGMRLSTALTPRVISCAEDTSAHIGLPRGCRTELEALFRDHGIALSIEDERQDGEVLDVDFHGNLTRVQVAAVRALLEHDIGLFVAPPGAGKTVVAINAIAERRRNTLVVVHRQPILEQWVAQLSIFLGIDAKRVGQIGGGKRKPNGMLDVAMIQSLVRNGEVSDMVAGYGHVVVDECHHVPAASFERVLSEVKAKYITGLTATPQRRDGHHPIIEMQMGPTRFEISPKSDSATRHFDHRLIIRDTLFRCARNDAAPRIQDLYNALAADDSRNQLIFDDVLHALEEGRSPILLTERRDHLEWFAQRLERFARNLVVLRGGMGAKRRRDVAERLATIPPNEERLVLATGRYIGEGFDDARLDTLFLALPVSWKGTLVQYAGRLHRVLPGKHEVRIYDYVDRQVPMLARMSERRQRGYRAMGYAEATVPTANGVKNSETVIEWDTAPSTDRW